MASAPRTETLPGLDPDCPPCIVQHRYARINGVRLHYVEAEPQAATVKGTAGVVCALHGFPEFWYSWRHQIPALAAAGFRVLAPDLRGYNESAKPAAVHAYQLGILTDDIAGLLEHAGAERAAVAGHDWGGVLAWQLAARRPERVEKLIILNAPHPRAFRREIRTPGQLLRSAYIFFFQLPGLPEALLRCRDYALLERAWRRQPVHAGAFREEDIRAYKQALAQPGALTAAVNYYRAALRSGALRSARHTPRIEIPVLGIWGERDRYLSPRLTEGLREWVPNLRLERIADASHWVQNDVPRRVNALMIDFLRPGGPDWEKTSASVG